ncbi:hypothetical protein [Pseudooceanicola sp.]|uniref:hypothetical protein n=1 Tax=Pseudooceanicola sp. TaxID=1914328 RepID=UPI00351812DE
MMAFRRLAAVLAVALLPGRGLAHASEQGFVLLLPTEIYTAAGAASVALTVFLLIFLPDRLSLGLFGALRLVRLRRGGLRVLTSCLSFLLLVWLIHIGLTGPRDPLANPMTLFIWTVWWVGFAVLQGLLGNLWHWVNPWVGPAALIRALLGVRPLLPLPHRLAPWLAVAGFLAFAGFLIADIAPADPARLARVVGLYWLAMFAAVLVFGPRWLLRAEAISLFMRCYARVGLFGRLKRGLAAGLPGWGLFAMPVPSLGLAVFILVLLGCGSFDGLNETFWWLALLGINPLECPGRSAVIWQNLAGLLAANAALVAVYALAIWLGLAISRAGMTLHRAFRVFAPSILPIALGYHLAHYFTSFLVDGQYALNALNDPYATGADLLGLGPVSVTTGFVNTRDSVRAIFLTQAGAVVVGHVLAIILAHALAVRAFGSSRRALISQAPLAVFMVLYTFFGLWLLAAPRGA